MMKFSMLMIATAMLAFTALVPSSSHAIPVKSPGSMCDAAVCACTNGSTITRGQSCPFNHHR